ncbi:MAG: DUF1080 domain-containing protein [Pirellulales bacterium]
MAAAGAAAYVPSIAIADDLKVPEGFTALFDGKTLKGWHGSTTIDPAKYATTADDQKKKWNDEIAQHWKAENNELINDGHGAYATTDEDYGDIELLIEYKTVPKADSGIYLRGCPQVQIWDSTEKEKFNIGADKGSGALGTTVPEPQAKTRWS